MEIQDLKTIIREHFDPLAREFQLRGPREENGPTYFSYYYFGENIGLNVYVEMDDVVSWTLEMGPVD